MVGEAVVELFAHTNTFLKGEGKSMPLTNKGNFERSPHLDTLRRGLVALRAKHGKSSPIGDRCSHLITQLENYPKAEDDDQRRNLRRSMCRTVGELEQRVGRG